MPILEGFPGEVSRAIVPGGPAGAHGPVPGILVGDSLIGVFHVSGDLVTNALITGEFTITDDGEIDNDLGTDTTDDFLIVVWARLPA